MWRATTERLARLGRRGGGRAASGVPRIGQLLTVRQVVDAHAKHRARYRPPDYCASWNTLGKLVREQAAERRALRAQPKLLQALTLTRTLTLTLSRTSTLTLALHVALTQTLTLALTCSRSRSPRPRSGRCPTSTRAGWR